MGKLFEVTNMKKLRNRNLEEACCFGGIFQMIKSDYINEIKKYEDIYYDKTSTYDEQMKIGKKLVHLYEEIANIYKEEGNFDETINFCIEAVEMQVEISGNDSIEVASGYINLGNAYYIDKNYGEAEKFFIKAGQLSWKIYNDKKTVEARELYAKSRYLLGKVDEAQIYYEDYWGYARNYYLESLKIYTELDENVSTVSSVNNVILCCGTLGKLYEKRKNINVAIRYFREGLKFGEKLSDKEQRLSSEYTECLEGVGHLLMSMEKYDEAQKYYNQALENRILIMKRYDNYCNIRDAAVSYRNLGDLLMKQKNIEEAKTYYINALKKIYEAYDAAVFKQEFQYELNMTVKSFIECDNYLTSANDA